MTMTAHPARRSGGGLLTGHPPRDEPCVSSGGCGDQGVDDLAAVGGVVSAPVVAEGRHDVQASAVVGGEVVGVLAGWLAQGIPYADSQPSVVGVQVDREPAGEVGGLGGLQCVGGEFAHQQFGGGGGGGQAPIGQDGPGVQPGAGNSGRQAAEVQAVG